MLELSADVAPLERTVEDISMDDGMVVIVIEGSMSVDGIVTEGSMSVDGIVIEGSMSVDDIIIEGSMSVDEELCARALLARRAGTMIALNRMMDSLSGSMTSFQFNLGSVRSWKYSGEKEICRGESN